MAKSMPSDSKPRFLHRWNATVAIENSPATTMFLSFLWNLLVGILGGFLGAVASLNFRQWLDPDHIGYEIGLDLAHLLACVAVAVWTGVPTTVACSVLTGMELVSPFGTGFGAWPVFFIAASFGFGVHFRWTREKRWIGGRDKIIHSCSETGR